MLIISNFLHKFILNSQETSLIVRFTSLLYFLSWKYLRGFSELHLEFLPNMYFRMINTLQFGKNNISDDLYLSFMSYLIISTSIVFILTQNNSVTLSHTISETILIVLVLCYDCQLNRYLLLVFYCVVIYHLLVYILSYSTSILSKILTIWIVQHLLMTLRGCLLLEITHF